MMKRKQRTGGFMLVEVLVSVVLFSIGVLGLLALHAHGSQTSSDSDDRMRAAVLASKIASDMWAENSTTATPSTYSAWQTAVADTTNGGLPNGAGVVTPGSPATITITWSAPWRSGTGVQKSQYVTKVQIP